MSRDTSQVAADRRLWLAERCPSCGAAAGARCRERSSARRAPPPRLALHAARGWRQRGCPACKARPGEPCLTPRGRIKPAPHAVRLSAARGELLSLEEVWRALERLGASGARVRFSGGGRQGTLESLSTDDGGRELARWAGESELAGALAAPDMGPLRQLPHPAADSRGTRLERRRALARARRHARGRALRTDPPSRRRPTPSLRHSSTRRATCRPRRLRAHRRKAHAGRASAAVSRSPRGPLLRQALPTSRLPRQVLRAQSGRAHLKPPERCSLCHGPMPTTGCDPRARYCNKRRRQAGLPRQARARTPASLASRRHVARRVALTTPLAGHPSPPLTAARYRQSRPSNPAHARVHRSEVRDQPYAAQKPANSEFPLT